MIEEWRQRVIERARAWVGTPYHHRARVLGAGVDCAGVIYAAYYEAGALPEIEWPDYGEQWWANREEEKFINTLLQVGFREITQEKTLPADVIVTHWGRVYAHGAIITEWPKGVHLNPDAGKVQEDLLDIQKHFSTRKWKFFTLEAPRVR